jgi:hypothetical protein
MIWLVGAVASAGQVEIVAPAGIPVSLRCPLGETVIVYRDGTPVETGDQRWVTDAAPNRICEVWLADEPVDWVPLQGRSWCDHEGCRTTNGLDDRGLIWVRGLLTRPELRCDSGRLPARVAQDGWTFEAPLDPCWVYDLGKRQGDQPVSWGSWVWDGRSWEPGKSR